MHRPDPLLPSFHVPPPSSTPSRASPPRPDELASDVHHQELLLPLPLPPLPHHPRRPAARGAASAGGAHRGITAAEPSPPPHLLAPLRSCHVLARAAVPRPHRAVAHCGWEEQVAHERHLHGASDGEEPSAELVEVPLAQIGEGITECELLRWFVREESGAHDYTWLPALHPGAGHRSHDLGGAGSHDGRKRRRHGEGGADAAFCHRHKHVASRWWLLRLRHPGNGHRARRLSQPYLMTTRGSSRARGPYMGRS